jgi:hypothetical protein
LSSLEEELEIWPLESDTGVRNSYQKQTNDQWNVDENKTKNPLLLINRSPPKAKETKKSKPPKDGVDTFPNIKSSSPVPIKNNNNNKKTSDNQASRNERQRLSR